MHDIGKYTHYAEGDTRFYEIITKSGPLTDEEFDVLKQHVDVNRFFSNKFEFMTGKERDNIRFAALDHHEKLDGSGYLNQKRGMQISLAGRIVAIADIYDAMIRKREYKSMVRPDVAMKHVTSLAAVGKLTGSMREFLNHSGNLSHGIGDFYQPGFCFSGGAVRKS